MGFAKSSTHPADWGSNRVGVRIFVFDERAAAAQVDHCEWIARQIKAGSRRRFDSPRSSSSQLHSWFEDMRGRFPLIGEAHPDDARGTEYCFFRNVIDIVFASSVGEEGVLQAWKLAEKHRLRVLADEELLPPKAEQDFHITMLHGKRSASGIAPHICFVVFDPDIAHAIPGKTRAWILTRREAELWSKDRSVLTGDRLSKWMDRFTARDMGALISEMRFARDIVFIRVDRRNGASMVGPVMELSHQLNLPFELYENLD